MGLTAMEYGLAIFLFTSRKIALISFTAKPPSHQATDTPETLDYPTMTEVTLGVASAMRKLLG